MPSKTIPQLTNGNPAQPGDLIPIDRSGQNFSVTAASLAGAGGITIPGSNIITPGAIPPLVNSGSVNATSTYGLYISGNAIASQFSGNVKVGFSTNVTGLDIVNAVIMKTNLNSNVVLSNTPLLFSGVAAVTIPSNTVLYCDPVNYTFDTNHDYYILFCTGTVHLGIMYGSSPTSSTTGASIQPGNSASGNQTSATIITGGVFIPDTGVFWRVISAVKIS